MLISLALDDAQDYLASLSKFKEELVHEQENLLSRWNNLESSWRDDYFLDFESQFEALMHRYKQVEDIYQSYVRGTEHLITQIENKISALPDLR